MATARSVQADCAGAGGGQRGTGGEDGRLGPHRSPQVEGDGRGRPRGTGSRVMPGATVATASSTAAQAFGAGPPGGTATRSTPEPARSMPPATGGRLGPRRTTSSRDQTTRTGRPYSSARRRASAATGEHTFPPNAPPLAHGDTGSPPGSHHDGVGLEVGRLDVGGPEGQVPGPGRHLERVQQREPAAPALHLAGEGPGGAEGLGDRVPSRPVGHRHQGARRAGVVGEPGPSEHDRRSDQLGGATLQGGAPAAAPRSRASGRRSPSRRVRCGAITPEDAVRRFADGLPAGAPAEVGDQGPVDPLVGTRPGGIEGGQSHHDPRGAEPALAAATSRPTRRPSGPASSAGRPSSVVTCRPASRRTGVTHATRGAPSTHTVQHPHWPWGLHPSLAERMPELLAQDLEQ